jgi:hypothetical protein
LDTKFYGDAALALGVIKIFATMPSVFMTFLIMYMSTIALRKAELVVLAVHAAAIVYMFWEWNVSEIMAIKIQLFGLAMAWAEWICVKWFNMGRYEDCMLAVPLWLPLAWSMVGMLAVMTIM